MSVEAKKCGPLTYVCSDGRPIGILMHNGGVWVLNQGVYFGHALIGADTLRDIATILDRLNAAPQQRGVQLGLDLGGLTS